MWHELELHRAICMNLQVWVGILNLVAEFIHRWSAEDVEM